jgi:hypothetical protein
MHCSRRMSRPVSLPVMIFSLRPHPDTPPPHPLSLQVSLVQHEALHVRYSLTGNLRDIVMPPQALPVRADGLWQTTCFELFLGSHSVPAYTEFNLSPSTAWAAYGFTGYRDGRYDIDLPEPPPIRTRTSISRMTLEARLKLPGLGADHRFGLSAVIDHGAFGKTYWAIAHAPGPPDFHHRDCFAGRLDAAGDA